MSEGQPSADSKKKKDGVVARPPPEEGRCCMWLESRHRYCHMQRTRGSLYCKPHTPDAARIPCPLDPHHTVLPQDLEKHLKRCPGTALSRASQLPYYSKDCNAGSDSEEEGKKDEAPSKGKGSESVTSPEKKRARGASEETVKESGDEDADEEALRKLAEAGIADADEAVVRALAVKVAAGYEKACEVIPSLETAVIEQLHNDACDKFDTESSRKHAAQHTSILAHMEKEGMLRRNTVFLELGAGTAHMSHLISLCLCPSEVVAKPERPPHQPGQQQAKGAEGEDSKKKEEEEVKTADSAAKSEPAVKKTETFVLVDRGRFRHKAERMQKYANPGHVFERVLMDIRDLDLSRVDTFKAAPAMVAYGKHLCGAASDLALRCINSWFGDGNRPVPHESTSSKRYCAIAIALCCFHCCDWRSYTNKAWLKSLGFTREDFTLLRSLTSWNTSNYPLVTATDATASSTAATESTVDKGFTTSEKRRLGMQARHILVAGRVLYLRQRGFSTKIVTYVPEAISPENLLLLAVWQPSAPSSESH